jgi:hypothetical protein
MRAEFIMGKTSPDSSYIPKRGELIQCDRLGDGSWLTLHVGDGKTKATDLPTIADYDLHERVFLLEKQVKELQKRISHE